MTLDLFTTSVITAVVVLVSSALFLFETMLRRDGASGRLWAVAFLAGTVTVLSYLVWAVYPGAFVAVAIGNAAFTASAAFLWLGARAYNERSLRIAGAVVAVGIVVPMLSVLIAGPTGGDWAGALPMFTAIAVFAILGAIETRRGAMGGRWIALGLTVVLAIEAAFFVGRIVAFLLVSPYSDVFVVWFGSANSSMLTVALTIVAVVVTSILRAGGSTLHGQHDTYVLHVGIDGVMTSDSFRSVVSTMLDRARRRDETYCLVALRVDDLAQIATAFGVREAETLVGVWRKGARRYAPTASVVGEGDDHSILVAYLTTSFADVRRTASIVHRRLLDDFARHGLPVVPVIGMGIALTDQFGYDFRALADAAEHAARRSASSPDASVIVAEA